MTLQLNGRQREVRLSVIGMHHGIARILPALVAVAFGAACLILQEPISIPVTTFVTPAYGRFGCLKMRLEQLVIAGPAPSMPERQAVEGRGIVRTIVGRSKGNPVAARQFPPAAFMEQFAGLSIPPVISPACLQLTQGS